MRMHCSGQARAAVALVKPCSVDQSHEAKAVQLCYTRTGHAWLAEGVAAAAGVDRATRFKHERGVVADELR
jgi:hypothetical protein